MFAAERPGKATRLFIEIRGLLTLTVAIEIHILIMGIAFKFIGADEGGEDEEFKIIMQSLKNIGFELFLTKE